jgi:hypothetical protein
VPTYTVVTHVDDATPIKKPVHRPKKKARKQDSYRVDEANDAAEVMHPKLPVLNPQNGEEEEKGIAISFCFFRENLEVDINCYVLVQKAIVITPAMVKLRDVENQTFKFGKTFSEGATLASGFILIPKNSEKPNKNSKDAVMVKSFVFFCPEYH